MSYDHNVAAAASAVISAFHSGAEAVKQVKKRNRKKKSEQAYKENFLLESLETGKTQIEQRFAADCQEFGPRFQAGDSIAQSKLYTIAISIQGEIVRSLQLMLECENAAVDLTALLESAVVNRRDALKTLDGLRQRLATQPEVPQQFSPNRPPSYSPVDPIRPLSYVPPAVTITNDPTPTSPQSSSLVRSITKGLSNRKRKNSAQYRASLAPTFEIPQQGSSIPGTPERLSSTFSEHMRLDSSPQPTQPNLWEAPELSQPHVTQSPIYSWGYEQRSSIYRQGSISAQSNGSDNRESLLYRNPSVSTTSTYSEMGRPSLSYSIGTGGHLSPTTPQDPAQRDWPFSPDCAINGFHPDQPPTNQLADTRMSCDMSIMGPPAATYTTRGPPAKANGYWGLCKGAWKIRNDSKKYLRIQVRPLGMYGSLTVWQCKYCAFESEPLSNKKPYTLDNTIRTALCGVRYRWAFLAKSHVKKKTVDTGSDIVKSASYGCMFCAAQGSDSEVYGNIETLMNHIASRHRKTAVDELPDQFKCIFGRIADSFEQFDINIP